MEDGCWGVCGCGCMYVFFVEGDSTHICGIYLDDGKVHTVLVLTFDEVIEALNWKRPDFFNCYVRLITRMYIATLENQYQSISTRKTKHCTVMSIENDNIKCIRDWGHGHIECWILDLSGRFKLLGFKEKSSRMGKVYKKPCKECYFGDIPNVSLHSSLENPFGLGWFECWLTKRWNREDCYWHLW